MRKPVGAFSLTELLVVIALVAFLSAIAIPSYRHYTIVAKYARYFDLINGIKMDAF